MANAQRTRTTTPLPQPVRGIAPQSLIDKVKEDGLPEPVYAAVGVMASLRNERDRLPQRLNDSPELLRIATQAGVDQFFDSIERTREGVRHRARDAAAAAQDSAAGAIGGVVTVVGHSVSILNDRYRELAREGEREVVAQVAERAVRKRVTVLQDQVAPRAARAAVGYYERKGRFDASKTGERSKRLAARSRDLWQRSSSRFHAMNTPVLLDEDRAAAD